MLGRLLSVKFIFGKELVYLAYHIYRIKKHYCIIKPRQKNYRTNYKNRFVEKRTKHRNVVLQKRTMYAIILYKSNTEGIYD